VAKEVAKKMPGKTADEAAADADATAMGPTPEGRDVGAEAPAKAEAVAMDGAAPSGREGRQVAKGPTIGYRDAPKELGMVVTAAVFPDGFLPTSWKDTPAACKNYSGKGHDAYVKVQQQPSGRWAPVSTD